MKHKRLQEFKKSLGSFQLGWESVELCVREGDGGEFFLQPEEGRIPRIVVGLDYEKWTDCLSVLLHEALECIMERRDHRYRRAGRIHPGLDTFTFLFNHDQFTEICAIAAMFLAGAMPEVARAWKERGAI